LTNIHCVERKSISDLFGSFASGRLYTQVEAMTKYYKVPCLLIEFDPLKSFSLQSVNDLGADIRNDNICSKMAVLVMHFPKLRILWSRTPHETLKLFKALKADHEEVDVNAAAAKGSEENVLTEEVIENEDARDLLLRLPGVNPNNARKIMSKCNSIAELAEMSRDDLKALLGPLTGQKLFTFFRQRLVE
jgi:DNA excision repair protein ERCC-4